MRLDKYLSFCLVLSRQEVKKLIKEKLVYVNGVLVTKDDYKVDEERDKVVCDNNEVIYKKYTYVILNKPKGYVTSTKDLDKTVMELLPKKYSNLSPVGRLDKDTEGLLLFTNDGMTLHNLTSPKKDINKVYYVELEKEIDESLIDVFLNGVTLDDGYMTKPAKLEILDEKKVTLTISEGKFHQVKRMFLSVNNKVTYLKRIRFANIILDETLKLGNYRELNDEEIKNLLQKK